MREATEILTVLNFTFFYCIIYVFSEEVKLIPMLDNLIQSMLIKLIDLFLIVCRIYFLNYKLGFEVEECYYKCKRTIRNLSIK